MFDLLRAATAALFCHTLSGTQLRECFPNIKPNKRNRQVQHTAFRCHMCDVSKNGLLSRGHRRLPNLCNLSIHNSYHPLTHPRVNIVLRAERCILMHSAGTCILCVFRGHVFRSAGKSNEQLQTLKNRQRQAHQLQLGQACDIHLVNKFKQV